MKNLTATMLVIGLVSCHKLSNKNESQDSSVSFFRKDSVSNFDFDAPPLVVDLNSVGSPSLARFEIKNKAINEDIRSKRNYYELYNYSLLSQDGRLFSVLGYYDLYTDLWLVSIDRDSTISSALIASLSGDEAISERVWTKVKSKDYFEKIRMKTIRKFSNPDTLRVIEGEKTSINIDKGVIVERITYMLAKDSILIRP